VKRSRVRGPATRFRIWGLGLRRIWCAFWGAGFKVMLQDSRFNGVRAMITSRVWGLGFGVSVQDKSPNPKPES